MNRGEEMNQLMTIGATKAFVLAAGLPDFNLVKDWGQDQGQAILILALIGCAIYFAYKREWGMVFGSIIVIGIVYLIVKNPEETIMEWIQALIDKLMGKGGG